MDEGLALAVVARGRFRGDQRAARRVERDRHARGHPGRDAAQAIVLAAVFNLLGPLLLGAAVADTIGGIVTVAPSAAIAVIGAGLAAAVAWNLVTWRLGLPSSSGHALVGGLVGAALVEGGVARGQLGRARGLAPGRRRSAR